VKAPPHDLVRLLALVSVLLGGCGSAEDPPHLTYDGFVSNPDARRDLVPTFDLYPHVPDGSGGKKDGSCTLGTASNCSYCGQVCPPSADTSSTARVCLSGLCDIQCKEEAYDVNGGLSDGCETTDDLPIHDTITSAQDLGSFDDCDSAQSATASLPSDGRKHQKAPTDRANGRADYFRISIKDTLGCVVEASVKVNLTTLPTGARYTVSAYYLCDSGSKQLQSTTQSAYGGAEVSFTPATTCSTLGDDSGTLYLKVSKDSGPHSASSYSVSITP
jgi:hypothetical protein